MRGGSFSLVSAIAAWAARAVTVTAVAAVAAVVLPACGDGPGDAAPAPAVASVVASAVAPVSAAAVAPVPTSGAPGPLALVALAAPAAPAPPPLQPALTAVAATAGRPGFAIDLRLAADDIGAAGFVAAAAEPGTTFVVTPRRDAVAVLDGPAGAVVGRLDAANEWGAPTVAPVVGDPGATWLEVRLAERPNGRTGFVHRDAVTLSATNWRVEVGIAARTLVVWQGATERLRVPVAVGRERTPTPVADGWFRVFLHGDGAGYGRYVVALGVHSEAVRRFNGGDGEVAIHGTSAEASIGAPTSNGCIRLDDAAITRLVGLGIPLGTPVALRP